MSENWRETVLNSMSEILGTSNHLVLSERGLLEQHKKPIQVEYDEITKLVQQLYI